MKRFIYILLAALLATAVVSLIFWLITGEMNIVAPIMGAMVAIILAVMTFKNKN